MRILYVTNFLEVGGVETNLVGLSTQLRRRGHEVTVLSSGGPLSEDLVRGGVRHITVPISLHDPAGLVVAAIHLRQLVEREGHAVIHSMSAAGNLATLLARRTRGRVFLSSPMGLQQSDREWAVVTDLRNRLLTWNSDRVLVISEEIAAALRRLRLAPERLLPASVVGVDLDRFASSRAAGATVRDELQIPRDAEVITTIGALHPRKRHDLLITAASRVIKDRPAARVLIVGEGPEREPLTRQIDALGLTRNVALIGARRDVPELLAATDVYVKPGIVEGFIGITVLEAMAAGVPVVAWATEDVRAAVTNEETGLLVPIPDTAAMANAVLRLLVDPSLASGLGSLGRLRVEEKFSLSAVASELEALYSALVGTQQSSARP